MRERIKALAAHPWHLGNVTNFKIRREKSHAIIKPRGGGNNRIVLKRKHLWKFNVHTKKGSLLKLK